MESNTEKKTETVLPFNLAKFFSFVSLLLILCSSVILSFFIGNTTIENMLESQKEYALLLSESINKQLFRKFALPVAMATGRVSLSDPAQYKLLDDVIHSQLHGLQLEYVRLYDPRHTVLYSTKESEVRRTDLYTDGIPLVYEGKAHHFDILSSIPYVKAFFTPRIPDKTFLLRTVTPLTVDEDFRTRLNTNLPPVLAVLEIVQDMTPQYRTAIRSQWIIVAGFAVSSFILFFLILFISSKAENTIRRRVERNRQLEAQLHQSEKLASMGQMVASIAHEIRNPLGIIRSSAEFLVRRHKSGDAVTQNMLTAIYDETCRLSTTVTEFLDYARPRNPRQDDIVIVEIVQKALVFLSPELERCNIFVSVDVEKNTILKGDPDLLYRAIYNILANALQAMGGEGKIFVTGRTEEKSTFLSFRDTGPGFSEENLSKVMEPFFTTKDTGTGLGLPIVQSITEAHGGVLVVSNAPEGGACIRLEFPNKNTEA